ncbi:MAG: leucine-rich repeat protein [Eggerthellaceae bacterium]|nr:leucine-rich repeat protein [Eggerthellaceae bacterium]
MMQEASGWMRATARFSVAGVLAAALILPAGAAYAEASANVWNDPDALLAYAGGEDAGQALEDDASDQQEAEEELVTIIVQLYPAESQDASLGFFSLFAQSDEDRHVTVKDQIRSLVGSSDSAGTGLFGFLSAQSDDGASDSFVELYDYYNVIDGFAIKAPASALEDIRALDSVKNAFIEQEFQFDEAESTESATAGSAIKNASSLTMTHADDVSETGAGQVIAVLDSGVEVTHEAFSGGIDSSSVALSTSDAAQARSVLSQGGRDATYVSEKIPFAYDYGDQDADVTPRSSHGTHVAAIAAANAGQTLGVAPDAQLIVMKVSSGLSDSIYESNLIAALDDVAVLAPDVVNMSIGSSSGFSDDASSTYADAIATLEGEGCTVTVSAGNDYTQYGGNSTDGEANPPSSDPDYGVVSDPAALASSFAVASVDNAVGSSYVTSADGLKVAYAQAQCSWGAVAQFSDIADGTYEYVDCGEASSDDLSALMDAYGSGTEGYANKILLVEDGMMQTASRAETLNALRPLAIVMYGYDDSSLSSPTVNRNTTQTPVVGISRADGLALRDAATKTLTVVQGATLEVSQDYEMSGFSSWGPTPELELKPEISAPGGDIYSAVTGGEYDYKSGTSMAAPHVAGLAALMDERLDEQGVATADRANRITALLMSTARPLKDDVREDGYYSPRKQGAGIADVQAALSTDVYLSVTGAEDGRPKAELGSSATGAWSFEVTLHNTGSQSRTFAASAVALSDAVDDGSFALSSVNYTNNGIAVSFSGSAYDAVTGQVTVPAGGTASYTVSIACDDAFRAAVSAENGTYVDGFAFLSSVDSGVDLSVPFLGFLGDWAAVPAFDGAIDDGGASSVANVYDSTLVNAATSGALGANPLDGSDGGDASKMVVSNAKATGAPSGALPQTGLLRNAQSLSYAYTDASGAAKTYSYGYVTKTSASGTVKPVESGLSTSPVFSGTSDAGLKMQGGTISLQISANPACEGATAQVLSYSFAYDTTPPALSTTATDDEIALSVSDGTYVAGVDFHDPSTGAYFYRLLPADMTAVDGVYEATVSLDTLQDAWVAAGLSSSAFPSLSDIPVYAWDYGLNYTTTAETPSDDQGFQIVDGVLKGYTGTSLLVEIPDTVTAIADGAFRNSSVETVIIPASVKSIDARAFANVTSLKQVTVEDSADEPSQLVSVGAEAFAGAGASGFSVLLPDSVTSLGERAFAQSKLKSFSVPAGVTALPASAFEASSASEVVLPDGLVTIGDNAFANCEDLTAVRTSASEGLPSSVTSLGDGAFGGTSGLVQLTLNDGLSSVGSRAFAGSAIGELSLPDSVTSLGSGALADASHMTSVHVGAALSADALVGVFAGSTAIQTFTVAASSEACAAVDGVLYSRDGSQLIAYPPARYGAYAMPDSVVAVADYACQDAAMTSVAFSSRLESVGAYAFASSSLEGALALPASLQTVGDHAFAGCGVTSVDMGGVQVVSDGAFASCAQLTQVDFGHVQTIGDSAFNPSTPLTSVQLPDETVSVGAAAFANNAALTSVTLGAGFSSSYESVFGGCANIAQIDVAEESASYYAEQNVLYARASDGLYLVRSLPTNTYTSYSVAAGTVRINSGAFKDNVLLEHVSLPEGLLTIESGAFNGCSNLASVDFPDSLKFVNGFQGTSISIADFGTHIVEINKNAFSGNNPTHLVVRGGQNGTYANSLQNGLAQDNQPIDTAYFGEGMVSANFSANRMAPPELIVVPSTMTSLSLRASSSGLSYDVSSLVVYAPEGTTGWNAAETALRKIGADPTTQLVAYTPLSVSATSDAAFTAGATVTVTATATGGVDGAKDYRFVQVSSDGSETVVQDWGSAATCSWKVASGSTLSAQVRDASYYSASAMATYDAPSDPTDEPGEEPAATQAMYRMYNPNGGEHFYTASAEERDWLSTLGWKYEGIGWTAPATSDAPVYRLYNPNGGDHHYTSSVEERDWLRGLGWKYEGIGWYSASRDGQALYRLYNPNAATGSHHYTTSAEERDYLASLGWQKEGVGWYGVK